MVWSKYNLLFEREGIYLLYNSLSNALVEISKNLFDDLIELSPGEECGDLDDDIKILLTRTKSLVSSDTVEINKLQYRTYQGRFNQKNLIITINPTLSCNFACPYCFEGNHPNTFMTEQIEDDVISYIKKFTEATSLSVSWFGGEPLLNFSSLVSLSKKLIALGLDYTAGIITNGYLLTPKIADQLIDLKIQTIQITLDGVREEHDKRRCLKNGSPTYDTIVKNIIYIAEYLPSLKINVRVNIDKDNLDSFLHIYTELANRYKSISVHPAFVKDVNGDGACQSEMSLNEIFNFLIDLYNKTGLDFRQFYPNGGRKECAVRKNNAFVIGPEGELYKCWNDVGKRERIYGYVSEGGLITNDAVLFDYLMEADQINDSKCLNCLLLPNCSGGCPHTRLLDRHRNVKKSCPIDINKITDYLWAHYCTKVNKKIHLPNQSI